MSSSGSIASLLGMPSSSAPSGPSPAPLASLPITLSPYTPGSAPSTASTSSIASILSGTASTPSPTISTPISLPNTISSYAPSSSVSIASLLGMASSSATSGSAPSSGTIALAPIAAAAPAPVPAASPVTSVTGLSDWVTAFDAKFDTNIRDRAGHAKPIYDAINAAETKANAAETKANAAYATFMTKVEIQQLIATLGANMTPSAYLSVEVTQIDRDRNKQLDYIIDVELMDKLLKQLVGIANMITGQQYEYDNKTASIIPAPPAPPAPPANIYETIVTVATELKCTNGDNAVAIATPIISNTDPLHANLVRILIATTLLQKTLAHQNGVIRFDTLTSHTTIAHQRIVSLLANPDRMLPTTGAIIFDRANVDLALFNTSNNLQAGNFVGVVESFYNAMRDPVNGIVAANTELTNLYKMTLSAILMGIRVKLTELKQVMETTYIPSDRAPAAAGAAAATELYIIYPYNGIYQQIGYDVNAGSILYRVKVLHDYVQQLNATTIQHIHTAGPVSLDESHTSRGIVAVAAGAGAGGAPLNEITLLSDIIRDTIALFTRVSTELTNEINRLIPNPPTVPTNDAEVEQLDRNIARAEAMRAILQTEPANYTTNLNANKMAAKTYRDSLAAAGTPPPPPPPPPVPQIDPIPARIQESQEQRNARIQYDATTDVQQQLDAIEKYKRATITEIDKINTAIHALTIPPSDSTTIPDIDELVEARDLFTPAVNDSAEILRNARQAGKTVSDIQQYYIVINTQMNTAEKAVIMYNIATLLKQARGDNIPAAATATETSVHAAARKAYNDNVAIIEAAYTAAGNAPTLAEAQQALADARQALITAQQARHAYDTPAPTGQGGDQPPDGLEVVITELDTETNLQFIYDKLGRIWANENYMRYLGFQLPSAGQTGPMKRDILAAYKKKNPGFGAVGAAAAFGGGSRFMITPLYKRHTRYYFA